MPKPEKWNENFVLVYDALNRRIKKTTNGETRLFYYNRNWQCLEERESVWTKVYIWGLRYVDDLVCQIDRGETLYSLADANWNVIALTNTTGFVLERYTYSAFGKRQIYDANFTLRATSLSPHFTRAFTSQVLDTETDLMLYRSRIYHPTLGRFIQRDPIGYEGDNSNLYCYVSSNPINILDPSGLTGGPNDRCKDICSPEHADKDKQATSVALLAVNMMGPPGIAEELADAAQWLPKLAPAPGIPGPIKKVGLSPLKEAVKAIKDVLPGLHEKMKQVRGGVEIWIKVPGKCCEQETCCFRWKRLVWKDPRKTWYRCTAYGEGRDMLKGFEIPGKDDVQAVIDAKADAIADAIPGCMQEAENAFKCPDGFKPG